MKGKQIVSIIGLIAMLLTLINPLAPALAPQPALADHTADPNSVTLVGNLQSELGCAGDWDPACPATYLAYDADDTVWQSTFNLPAGAWEYKAALNDSWDENYGANAMQNGANIGLSLGSATEVKFYYDHGTHWITDDVNSIIATVPGSFQSELGCPGDWDPGCLRSWLQDPDGDGIYAFSTSALPAGNYEAKVAINESWDENYGAGGVQNGPNIAFDVPEGATVTFTYEHDSHLLTISTDTAPPELPTVNIPGSFQSELGCAGDWDPACEATYLAYDEDDTVWQGTFSVPSGSYEYKAALNGSWDENYGQNATLNGPNIPLSLGAQTEVKFYYDHDTHWITDNQNSVIATVPGSFQSELGCPGDWDPGCLRSWLQDPDGDGTYSFSTSALPAGNYEAKVAINESWDENYGAGGVQGGDNYAFSMPTGATVTFTYDPVTHILTITTGGLEPGDELLVSTPLRTPAADQVFYFTMTDRFANGDPSNDTGGSPSGDPLVHGFLPTDKGYYHGGDLAGLSEKLDYLEQLGVTAIWVTPPFKNRWVQGDGTLGGSSAGYHGYWQIDYTQIDPHFGTNAEMQAFVDAAHQRNIKVFFDIVINHTGDVISYEEGQFSYRNKADFPYRDADGNIFDDRDYVGTGTFPELDPALSFPYTPVFLDPADASVKAPDWLNNPIYYHNRGDSTFAGESSTYGDFFGLDDLFTEHPVVVEEMIQIHKDIISQYRVDGFRVDTVKHVNDELWEQFVPEILSHAADEGITDFYLFGEVFDGDPAFTSHYTTTLPFPAVLDFGFDGAARDFATASTSTDSLRDFFASDDYFTDDDSNVYGIVKFTGNHDIGRLGYSIDDNNPGASDEERVRRSKLATALMYFSRGAPVLYYGDEQGFTGSGGDKDARQDMFPSQVAEYNDADLIGTEATTADDNFDTSHPLYTAFSEFAALRQEHLALRQGAQIHRFSQGSAGIYAFSRLEREERAEYIVALNNSTAPASASFQTETPDATFSALYPEGAASISSDGGGWVSVELPALSFAVYQAGTTVPGPEAASGISIYTPAAGATVGGRFEVGVALDTNAYAEVTFAVSVNGGDYQVIGVDDNAPYRVFYNADGLPEGTELTFKAISQDLAGNLNADKVTVITGQVEPPPGAGPVYAILHYNRPDGDYGDHTTGDFNDFWGLHLWGDIQETIDWTAPKPFLGEDEYGRFAWVHLEPNADEVGFIVHRGDTKDGTDADRFFNPSATPEIWLKAGDATTYSSQAEAQGYVTVHYHRPDGDYDGWGLHLWGDAIHPDEGTEWDTPKPPSGLDDFGLYWDINIVDPTQAVNFIIHRGDEKDPGPDQSFIPQEDATVWIMSGDETIYKQKGAALGFATLHYHRPAGDYGDVTSTDYNDFWGLHTWDGADDPGWTTPRKPDRFDTFGALFEVPLFEGAVQMGYIFHRGDEKDPGPDQFLVFAEDGYEVWQLQGADPENPYILPVKFIGGPVVGNINEQRAYWVSQERIVWAAADDPRLTYTLHYAPEGGLQATETGITGGSALRLQGDPAGLPDELREKFPHLASLPVLVISPEDLALVPEVLKGQIAVSAVNEQGASAGVTGLQIPGVLDDLYTYNGELGVSWDGDVPTLQVWAPTAKAVSLHLFPDSDPASLPGVLPMELDPASGVWSITGESSWKGQFYLYEVQVYVHSTGQVEHNLVSDPYSHSLSMNSTRSQVVDLRDPALKPQDWEALSKPALAEPEDISIYEIHMRDFSVHDPAVPEELKGTYKAFTLPDSFGMAHLRALEQAGLTHLHLLPTFDIATIDEDKSNWQTPDPEVLESYPPDSDQQQVLIGELRHQDPFNWGYDPFHYTVPEGSYSTDPDGSTRIVEYREMIQALNEMGLRVVMDVVYNHTHASGQAEKSVLDKVVPGYYHRLNERGLVETSTCCANTASEHNMMEKLMIDSLVTWAVDYKVDAFRFDLMGHHMKSNMLNVRAALDALTLEEHGVDGKSIYIYGEGWNFGEVADNARGVNATQFNMAGTGIGTFNDRLRDAVRGIGPFESGQGLIDKQGFANGSYYDPNPHVTLSEVQQWERLMLQSDQVRVGMAGNLRDYQFIDRYGDLVSGADVDYNGSPAGYTLDPQEEITYISKHDNQTLYDINVFAAPQNTSMEERVRMQNVGLSTVLLGQGIPFLHAGSDMLRSKSLDRDSYDSGDWFNKLDFTYMENNFGVGLPPAWANQSSWDVMRPFLADTGLKAGEEHISRMAELTRDLFAIRYSSPLFRLKTAEEVQMRQSYLNTGPGQLPGLIVMLLSDKLAEDIDPTYESIVVLINANHETQVFDAEELMGLSLVLHPVQRASVDARVKTSTFDTALGEFQVPGRTTAVFVEYARPQERLSNLIGEVQELYEQGILNRGQTSSLVTKLESAMRSLDRNRPGPAINQLNAFIQEVVSLEQEGVLTPDQSQALTDAAMDIIWQIENGV
jgi:pullulanase-type alpha-1,6-glucosidase